ncbi:MAG TPA: hypothetical protein VH414_21010 [Lichenihabitans sp.]|jgi:hypothetical protein|nr:hypothetical protein [Lichenihabitans sp.]
MGGDAVEKAGTTSKRVKECRKADPQVTPAIAVAGAAPPPRRFGVEIGVAADE